MADTIKEETKMHEQLKMYEVFGQKITGMGEPHMACALLLDTSFSMSMGRGGETPIHNLSEGIRRFKAAVSEDPLAQKRVDVAIITFSDHAQKICDFTPVVDLPTPELEATGMTNMAEGIQMAIDLVKDRTQMYQNLGTPCYKPWILMITDGASTSEDAEMEKAAQRIALEESKGSHGHLSFWGVGVGNYDSKELFKLTNRVVELRAMDFTQLFDWLSESFTEISRSQVDDRVALPPLGEDMRKSKPDRCIDEDWY